jgi:hypothetical protein
MRNRTGIIQRFQTGMDEFVISDVIMTVSGMGCGLGGLGHRQGDIPVSSPTGVMTE